MGALSSMGMQQLRNDRGDSVEYRYVVVDRGYKPAFPAMVRFERSEMESQSIPYGNIMNLQLEGERLRIKHHDGEICIEGIRMDLLRNELESMRVLGVFQAPETETWRASRDKAPDQPIPESITFAENS